MIFEYIGFSIKLLKCISFSLVFFMWLIFGLLIIFFCLVNMVCFLVVLNFVIVIFGINIWSLVLVKLLSINDSIYDCVWLFVV